MVPILNVSIVHSWPVGVDEKKSLVIVQVESEWRQSWRTKSRFDPLLVHKVMANSVEMCMRKGARKIRGQSFVSVW